MRILQGGLGLDEALCRPVENAQVVERRRQVGPVGGGFCAASSRRMPAASFKAPSASAKRCMLM